MRTTTCFAAVILASVLGGANIAPYRAPSPAQSKMATDQRRQAIAFLLGWDSKLVIVETTRAVRQQYLANIRLQLRELGVVLPHSVEYYFPHAMENTERGQAFSEEAMAQLTKRNPEVANHFAVAHNVLLTLAHTEVPEATRRVELEELIAALDIPDDLRRVPNEGIVTWVNNIHQYFVSAANRSTKPQS